VRDWNPAAHPGGRCLDTCVLINILATDRVDEILEAQASPMLVASVAVSELRSENTVVVNQQRRLRIVDLASEELGLFVEYAAEVDDGEAATIAICVRRRLQLVTDDRKAISFAVSNGVSPPIAGTSDLLLQWAEVACPAPRLLRTVLEHIRDRASFVPPPSDPNRTWWLRMMQG